MNYCVFSKEDEISNSLSLKIKDEVKLCYDDNHPDYVVAVGGDGTIIRAAHAYPEAVIFGLHTGHLGFLTSYTPDDVDVLINDLNREDFISEKMNLLSCKINAKDSVIESFAVNEVTIMSPPRTLILDVYVNDKYLEQFRGTGFCVSTPFGSTAYNKALHGSVIDPAVDVLQLTEIAGINSNAFRTLSEPLILSSKRKIRFEAKENIYVFITVDHISYAVKDFVNMEIGYDGSSITMGCHKHESFIRRIRRSFLKPED